MVLQNFSCSWSRYFGQITGRTTERFHTRNVYCTQLDPLPLTKGFGLTSLLACSMPQADEVFFLDRYYWERLRPLVCLLLERKYLDQLQEPHRQQVFNIKALVYCVCFTYNNVMFLTLLFEILRNHVLLKTHKSYFWWFVKSQRLLYLASRKGRGLFTLEQECLTTRRGCGHLVENLPLVPGCYSSPQYADPYSFNNIIAFQYQRKCSN